MGHKTFIYFGVLIDILCPKCHQRFYETKFNKIPMIRRDFAMLCENIISVFRFPSRIKMLLIFSVCFSYNCIKSRKFRTDYMFTEFPFES